MIHILPDSTSAFAGLDLQVEPRALTHDPLTAIRTALTAALPDERAHEALHIADVSLRDVIIECYTLNADRHIVTLQFTFAPCAVSAQYPDHRCPECRYFLDDDARGTCRTCGARLSI